MLESEQQRYSKFDEPIRACLQRYPQLTEHSFLFNSFLHINRVPPISWLAWQGKRMPLYGWTIGTFFLNATGLCSFSIQGNIVVRDSAFWPRPKNVVHHFHVLLYYNELCSYTARFKTCQENSIFSVYASVLLTTESSHFNALSPIILLGTPFLSWW